MQNQMRRCFVVISVFIFLIGAFFVTPGSLFAKAMSVTTEVNHSPIDFFVPAKRIQLDATVTDKHAVKLVRCYFKADEQAEYVFVEMERIDKNRYRAILPSPADYTHRIKYLFLAVNADNQVVKTQTFTVTKGGATDVPEWQEVRAVGVIAVYTELSKAPETVSGFSDSITVDAVESSARFGMVVGGIYSASAMASSGGTAGTAAAATSGGTITATGSGLSTAAIVGITAGGLAAAGGGVAVAANNDSGGHGGSNNPNASITWSDTECGASLRVVFAGKEKGISLAGEPIEVKGLPVGDHDLAIYNEAGTESGTCSDGISHYTIILGGGATFAENGSTRIEDSLPRGGSETYEVNVPGIGSANFKW